MGYNTEPGAEEIMAMIEKENAKMDELSCGYNDGDVPYYMFQGEKPLNPFGNPQGETVLEQ